MARYGLVIDVSRCVGCYACFLACRDEHAGNDYLPVSLAQPAADQRWIDVRERERGSFPKVKVDYVPVPCLHCADAPCIRAATGGAIYRRDDGIVLIDPVKAVGQRDLVAACPYRVIFWNEEKNVAQKCTLCAHLLDDGWKQPRCAEVCPTQAIVFGDTADPTSDIAKLRAGKRVEDLHPEFATKPLVQYLGLPKRFVVGEIVFADHPDEPAEGVGIVLHGDGERLTTRTDNYGDFEFDGLAEAANYRLLIEHPGYRAREVAIPARAGLNLGMIVLEPVAGAAA
ncbi:MAG: 4Fe-4S dicluster domain-containing protein [Xanthobacteraceae bacterium]